MDKRDVEGLDKLKFDVNESKWDFSPLGYAVEKQDKEMIVYMLDAGADMEKEFYVKFQHYTPLGYAIHKQNKDLVSLLLERGAKTSTRFGEQYTTEEDWTGRTLECNWTPLGLAVSLDNAVLVTLLLSAGADADKRFTQEYRELTPVEYAKVKDKKNALAAMEKFAARQAVVPASNKAPSASNKPATTTHFVNSNLPQQAVGAPVDVKSVQQPSSPLESGFVSRVCFDVETEDNFNVITGLQGPLVSFEEAMEAALKDEDLAWHDFKWPIKTAMVCGCWLSHGVGTCVYSFPSSPGICAQAMQGAQ